MIVSDDDDVEEEATATGELAFDAPQFFDFRGERYQRYRRTLEKVLFSTTASPRSVLAGELTPSDILSPGISPHRAPDDDGGRWFARMHPEHFSEDDLLATPERVRRMQPLITPSPASLRDEPPVVEEPGDAQPPSQSMMSPWTWKPPQRVRIHASYTPQKAAPRQQAGNGADDPDSVDDEGGLDARRDKSDADDKENARATPPARWTYRLPRGSPVQCSPLSKSPTSSRVLRVAGDDLGLSYSPSPPPLHIALSNAHSSTPENLSDRHANNSTDGSGGRDFDKTPLARPWSRPQRVLRVEADGDDEGEEWGLGPGHNKRAPASPLVIFPPSLRAQRVAIGPDGPKRTRVEPIVADPIASAAPPAGKPRSGTVRTEDLKRLLQEHNARLRPMTRSRSKPS